MMIGMSARFHQRVCARSGPLGWGLVIVGVTRGAHRPTRVRCWDQANASAVLLDPAPAITRTRRRRSSDSLVGLHCSAWVIVRAFASWWRRARGRGYLREVSIDERSIVAKFTAPVLTRGQGWHRSLEIYYSSFGHRFCRWRPPLPARGLSQKLLICRAQLAT